VTQTKPPPANPGRFTGCYRNSLELAVAHGVKTIAFPAISCGIYGYPIPDAAQIAVATVREFLSGHEELEQVIFACFGAEVLTAFEDAVGANR
jgi:O-acetyl-ADP-ribose deacetylase (regulator of RNase III)